MLELCDSLPAALELVYPEREWLPWSFPREHGYWLDWANRDRFLSHLARRHSLKRFSALHFLTTQHFLEANVPLFQGKSLLLSLEATYPQFSFTPWLFRSTPNAFWANQANHESFLDWALKGLHAKVGSLLLSFSSDIPHSCSGLLRRLQAHGRDSA